MSTVILGRSVECGGRVGRSVESVEGGVSRVWGEECRECGGRSVESVEGGVLRVWREECRECGRRSVKSVEMGTSSNECAMEEVVAEVEGAGTSLQGTNGKMVWEGDYRNPLSPSTVVLTFY